jgi:predicted ATPase with chaperone activity
MMEKDRRTFRPVRILVAGRTVRTVMGAGKLLTDQWPTGAAARKRAEMTVLDAFNEVKSPEEARQALLIAASEAHILVGE